MMLMFSSVHRDEEVGPCVRRLSERGESGAVALYRHDVGHSLHVSSSSSGVGIGDRYVVVAAAEHLRRWLPTSPAPAMIIFIEIL